MKRKKTLKSRVRMKYKQSALTNPKEIKVYTRKADKTVPAKRVGLRRVSSGPNKGKWYKETRVNRSDVNRKKKL